MEPAAELHTNGSRPRHAQARAATCQRVQINSLPVGTPSRAVAALQDVLALPDEPSVTTAVTPGSSGAVTHYALDRARFTPGETVPVPRAGAA